MDNKFILAVYVDNQFGVLTRVTSMFTRRGFNIDTLTVGETESPEYSRITMTLSGDGYAREQMINQLRKLHNVKQVEILDRDKCYARELALIKVRNDPANRQELMTVTEIFRGNIIDYSADALSIECTGDNSKIDAFTDILRPFGIIEMCRTGVVALERGKGSILKK